MAVPTDRSIPPVMITKVTLGGAKQVVQMFGPAQQAVAKAMLDSVADGVIPVKYKELIAVGVALTTQCPYCIEIHSNNARKAGATDAELAEAGMVAAALRAGAAVTHATHALAS